MYYKVLPRQLDSCKGGIEVEDTVPEIRRDFIDAKLEGSGG